MAPCRTARAWPTPGITSVESNDGTKHSFEWGPRSVFAPPLNLRHQFFNASGQQPARLAICCNMPAVYNLFRSEHFIFENQSTFPDREGDRAVTVVGLAHHLEPTRLREPGPPQVAHVGLVVHQADPDAGRLHRRALRQPVLRLGNDAAVDGRQDHSPERPLTTRSRTFALPCADKRKRAARIAPRGPRIRKLRKA